MTARSPGSVFLSILLHGLMALVIVLLSEAWSRQEPPSNPVFEIVTGPLIDEPAAEEPALIIPDSPPLPEFTPPEPEPEPEPVPPPMPEKAPPPKVEKPAPPKEQPKPERTSYEEYVRRHPPAPPRKSPAPKPIPAPTVNTRDITPSAVSPPTGGSALQNELDAYFARLRTALRQNHEKPPGLSDLLTAVVEFFMAADGSISRVRVAQSSGSTEFDQSCLDAFTRMGTVGPRPDEKSDVRMVTFRMREM